MDDGPGIPLESHNDVIEPFFKLDTARGDHGGFGLGLFIDHDIVQSHGGSLSLINAQPQVLIVEINLPPPALLR
ncbi:ATP-binding protein [Rhizobium tropici]|uniref:ATP-binding protein n=1 Tax=Rhizobium tropici TaxID=398 RepID=UPI00165EC510